MWLAVSIGNSRQHWGWFTPETLHTEHHLLDYWDETVLEKSERVVVASVVPGLLPRWQDHSQVRILSLADIPLAGMYPTLGIDRALNLIGAVRCHGAPSLVVDFGTAITLSAADRTGGFAGGCILPGFRMQLRALGTATAGLPEVALPEDFPSLWAAATEPAIQAGVLRVTLAGLQTVIAGWRGQVGRSTVIATGGDSALVCSWLPELFDWHDPDLVLWGIRAVAGE